MTTSAGRVIFNRTLPEEMQFVNRLLDKGEVNELVNQVYRRLGDEATILMVDASKDLGFEYATRSGVTRLSM